MAHLEPIVGKMEMDVSPLKRGMHDAQHAMEGIGGPVAHLTNRITGLATTFGVLNPVSLAVGGGLAALGLVMEEAIAKATEMETQMLRLTAQIKATGGAVGLTTADLNDFAEEIANTTLATDESVRQAEGTLLRFSNVTGDNFKRAIRLSQDLASIMGTDISSAATTLGRALEAPEQGFMMLRRAGIIFSAGEKDAIKTMAEAGDTAGAQEAIFKKLEKTVGGVGTAEAGGLAGAAHRLGEEWEHFLERVGNSGPVERATTNLNKLANWAKKLHEVISDPVKTALSEPSGGMSEASLKTIETRMENLKKQGLGAGDFSTKDMELYELLKKRVDLEQKSKKLREDTAKAVQKQRREEDLAGIAAEKQKKIDEKNNKIIVGLFEDQRKSMIKSLFTDYARHEIRMRSLNTTKTEAEIQKESAQEAEKNEKVVDLIRAGATRKEVDRFIALANSANMLERMADYEQKMADIKNKFNSQLGSTFTASRDTLNAKSKHFETQVGGGRQTVHDPLLEQTNQLLRQINDGVSKKQIAVAL